MPATTPTSSADPPAVHRIRLAQVNLRGQFNPPTFVDTRIDVFAYVVVTGTDVVLVDTGVGEGNEHVDRTFEPSRTPIAEALARVHVAVQDVGIVVNSHLHFDHCGNNRQFAHAEFFVQAPELDVARNTTYTVREWFDFDGARINPVTGDQVIADGIRLIASPGHTPGHQSVLVARNDGDVLIAAQASYTADEFRRGGDPAQQAHEGFESSYTESIRNLRSIGARRILFSHDSAEV